MLFSGFYFFYDGDPANPLIAGEGSETITNLQQIWVRIQNLFHVLWEFMQGAWGDVIFGHDYFLRSAGILWAVPSEMVSLFMSLF